MDDFFLLATSTRRLGIMQPTQLGFISGFVIRKWYTNRYETIQLSLGCDKRAQTKYVITLLGVDTLHADRSKVLFDVSSVCFISLFSSIFSHSWNCNIARIGTQC